MFVTSIEQAMSESLALQPALPADLTLPQDQCVVHYHSQMADKRIRSCQRCERRVSMERETTDPILGQL